MISFFRKAITCKKSGGFQQQNQAISSGWQLLSSWLLPCVFGYAALIPICMNGMSGTMPLLPKTCCSTP